MRFLERSVEKCVNDLYQDARRLLLVHEAEVEVYEVAAESARAKVAMLKGRIARLKAQIEEQES